MPHASDKPTDKDRKLVDTGWGIKPDAQPANKRDVADHQSSLVYGPGAAQTIDDVIRTQQRNFNTACRVIIEPGRTRIIDLNKDVFTIEGLTFGDPGLIELLGKLGAAFDPQTLRRLGPDHDGTREYACTSRHPWGEERSG